jgi:hypothetical protein
MQIVEIDRLAEIRSSVKASDVDARLAEFKQRFDIQSDVSPDELKRAAKTSVALDALVDEYRLGSMAYFYESVEGHDHQDVITSVILGFSHLTANGVPVAGEYEVKNAQAMKIMDAFGVGGSFTEYYAMDYDDDIVLMGHDGPGHIAIAQGRTKVRPLEVYHGKVEASMRFAKGSGVVSSLVLIYTPWPPDDWNELDIECLGNTTGKVQFNHMVNIPPADPATEHLQFPELIDMGFDPTASFHTYTIEWLPDSVRFLVDGVVVHQPTEEISRLVLPQNILLTIWASDAPGWAGPIDDTTAPTVAEVDWIRVYSYAGQ